MKVIFGLFFFVVQFTLFSQTDSLTIEPEGISEPIDVGENYEVFQYHSDKLRDSMIIGSWKTIREAYNDWGVYDEIISFYPDGTYQASWVDDDSSGLIDIKIGEWKMIDSNKGVISNMNYVNPYWIDTIHVIDIMSNDTVMEYKKHWNNNHIYYEMDTFQILSLTQSSLRFEFKSLEKITVNVPYRKLDQQLPKERVYEEDTSECVGCYDVYLVNSLKPDKKRKVYKGLSFSIDIDGEYEDNIMNYNGDIYDFNDTIIRLSVFSEDLNAYNYTHNFNSKTEYISYWMSNMQEHRIIPRDKIEDVYTSSNFRYMMEDIGAFMMLTSTITTLFIAPLVSIKYKDGGFNSDTYFKVAGAGLIGFSVGVPLMLMGKDKRFKLTTKYGVQSKKHWYLEKNYRED